MPQGNVGGSGWNPLGWTATGVRARPTSTTDPDSHDWVRWLSASVAGWNGMSLPALTPARGFDRLVLSEVGRSGCGTLLLSRQRGLGAQPHAHLLASGRVGHRRQGRPVSACRCSSRWVVSWLATLRWAAWSSFTSPRTGLCRLCRAEGGFVGGGALVTEPLLRPPTVVEHLDVLEQN